ncbi:hypothetical protein QE152_g9951 [Popillia japonica]|uniref:Uncharacterized protein n=1 Tax=Popillia japonica TaxID=7064 RepID=A0AAW1LWE1_POPJA
MSGDSKGLKFSYVRKICEYVFTKQKLKIKLLAQTFKIGHKTTQRKGDLRLTVDGGQDMENSLQNEIKREMDHVQVATRKLGMTTTKGKWIMFKWPPGN